ncbi:MAG TPA: DUF1573 domain-containing protein [Anaerolineae bacterium]|nr:DUF1573 domain-containing protein [Anaerolineae bacterium]
MAEKQTNVRQGRPARPTPRSRKRRRRSSPGGANPLVWFGGILGVVVVLVSVNLVQSGALAEPPLASRSEAAGDLLPLVEAKRPLKGGHDMRLIPQQTPVPQPAPADVAVARLDLPSASHDFGLLPKRPNVAHVSAVQNTGAVDLVIQNLVTSCGCTTAELSSSVIPPGRRADLKVVFDPDYHPTEGEVVRLVWFATNDPTQPWVELRFTAEVE